MQTRHLRTAGFTLVELAVVVVIVGVLAAFAVPRFTDSVERSKSSEAFNFQATIHAAQERYHARQGIYAARLAALDVDAGDLEYFTVGEVAVPAAESSLETGWELTLTRFGHASGFGAYTVVFNQEGFDGTNSTILPQVSPLQTGGDGS